MMGDMDELSARFELLKLELAELQAAIRNNDIIHFQIKGWAVTVALASAGFAFSTHVRSVALLGIVAAIIFSLFDSQRMLTQRSLIDRCRALETSVASRSIEAAISREAGLNIPGLASSMIPSSDLLSNLKRVLAEARRPGHASLYVALISVLALAFVMVN